ncbi:MAG: V-type ATP synthase subunit E [bacterium]
MALKDIEEKIISDAEAETETIISEAQVKAKEILKKAEEEGNVFYESFLSDARLSAKKEIERVASLARLSARDRLLALKTRLMSEVFEKSLKTLKSLSGSNYEAVILNILRLIGPLPDRVNVVCPKGREKETEEAVKGTKLKTDFKFSKKTFDGVGGFIVSTDQLQIDGSFERLVDELKKEIEPEIIGLLFGGKSEV